MITCICCKAEEPGASAVANRWMLYGGYHVCPLCFYDRLPEVRAIVTRLAEAAA